MKLNVSESFCAVLIKNIESSQLMALRCSAVEFILDVAGALGPVTSQCPSHRQVATACRRKSLTGQNLVESSFTELTEFLREIRV